MRRHLRLLCAILALGMLSTAPASAQYFGRNKVQYDDFDFKILSTDHFEIFFYSAERTAIEDVARMSERWYDRHTRTFLRTFREKKPLIFYANDADFQQTNVTQGQIGQGTGGFTEPLKERVTMPLTGIYSETDHVLGHELVHSFQYDIALNRQDSTNFQISELPLWLVEGMAEYLSVGRQDPHTTMWLRDAILQDDLPTIRQMTRSQQYFPYRFGQAYMAYMGGKYGDNALTNLYKLSGQVGVDSALVYTLGIQADSLSKEWKRAVRNNYLPLMAGRTAPSEAGRLMLSEEQDGGRINIAPAVSPNGRYVAFLSERDIFSINLYVADAKTGEIIEEFDGPASTPHMDALRFINSAGAWSPDGQRLAFVTFAGGDNEIVIWNINSDEVERRFKVKGVTAMANPTWSPDGQRIAFSGLEGGISDLYVYNLQTKTARQLTDDRYADLQPTWSSDGQQLAFATDRGPNGTDFETLNYAKSRLGLIDVETGEMQVLRPFGDALHHNPQFAPDGNSLYFISTHDGFKDIYRHEMDTGETYRVTKLKTGVSGITALSPAMTVARETGQLMFSVFAEGNYSIFSLSQAQAQGEPAEQIEGTPTAALLPPFQAETAGLVGDYLSDPLTGLPERTTYEARDYNARLSLDRVAPPAVGAGYSPGYGVGLSGGIAFQFSDMLGDHNLTAVAQANGTLKDIGGQVSYVNLDNRFNYGGSASHVPYRDALLSARTGPRSFVRILRRIYRTSVSGLSRYPLSTTQRFELSAGVTRYGFGYELEQFIGNQRRRRGVTPEELADLLCQSGDVRCRQQFESLPSDAIYLATSNLAFVGDYSFFGFTSPVRGGRYRFGVTPIVGTENIVTVLGDYRRYLFMNPITLAGRGLFIGNFGADPTSGTRLGQEYLGSSYYPGFVRGYSFNSFENDETCTPKETENSIFSCAEQDRLQGTRIAMASVELRFPLLGTETLGLINFPYLPTELSLFTDAGLAWTGDELPSLDFVTDLNDLSSLDRFPVVSSGISARFNILGYVVLEAYYAYPYQRPERGAHFGFQLQPGW